MDQRLHLTPFKASRAWTSPAIGILLLTALVAAAYGSGRLLNYDSAYSLLWGSQLANGQIPDITVPYAPTQHPLTTLLGALLTLPGTGPAPSYTTAIAIWELLSLLALGTLGWLTYALGKAWFGTAAGIAAAAIILTREPIMSFGIRAYLDIPYLCLILAALLTETRKPKSGTTVLILLGLAGLLRPEAWLFSLAYLAYLKYHQVLRPAHLFYAAAAPLIWAATDLIQTDNPIYSFTETQEAAANLGRITGITNVPENLPRRLGEILREPGLIAAAGGGLLTLTLLRDRTRLAVASGIAAITAFTILATTGLPILTRYLLLPATILTIFAAAGLLGWTQLPKGHPWRTRWITFAAVCTALFLITAPSQLDRLRSTNRALTAQRTILLDARALSPNLVGCPVSVPNRRPVPHLALWTGNPPQTFRSAQDDRRYTLPALTPTAKTKAKFVLNKADTNTYLPPEPQGTPKTRSSSWTLTGRCPN